MAALNTIKISALEKLPNIAGNEIIPVSRANTPGSDGQITYSTFGMTFSSAVAYTKDKGWGPVTDEQSTYLVTLGSYIDQKADWNETDANAYSYIKNKPVFGNVYTYNVTETIDQSNNIPTSQAVYDHISQGYVPLNSDQKIDNQYLPDSIGVQADWSETDANTYSYIKNKPALGTASEYDVIESIDQSDNIPTSQAVYTYVGENYVPNSIITDSLTTYNTNNIPTETAVCSYVGQNYVPSFALNGLVLPVRTVSTYKTDYFINGAYLTTYNLTTHDVFVNVYLGNHHNVSSDPYTSDNKFYNDKIKITLPYDAVIGQTLIINRLNWYTPGTTTNTSNRVIIATESKNNGTQSIIVSSEDRAVSYYYVETTNPIMLTYIGGKNNAWRLCKLINGDSSYANTSGTDTSTTTTVTETTDSSKKPIFK